MSAEPIDPTCTPYSPQTQARLQVTSTDAASCPMQPAACHQAAHLKEKDNGEARGNGDTDELVTSSEDRWLDIHHQEMVQHVLDKDTPEARNELAARFTAELTDEIHTLRSDQKELGTSEQICAIAASGWVGWARFFIVASWVLMMLDSLIWFAGGTRVLNIE